MQRSRSARSIQDRIAAIQDGRGIRSDGDRAIAAVVIRTDASPDVAWWPIQNARHDRITAEVFAQDPQALACVRHIMETVTTDQRFIRQTGGTTRSAVVQALMRADPSVCGQMLLATDQETRTHTWIDWTTPTDVLDGVIAAADPDQRASVTQRAVQALAICHGSTWERNGIDVNWRPIVERAVQWCMQRDADTAMNAHPGWRSGWRHDGPLSDMVAAMRGHTVAADLYTVRSPERLQAWCQQVIRNPAHVASLMPQCAEAWDKLHNLGMRGMTVSAAAWVSGAVPAAMPHLARAIQQTWPARRIRVALQKDMTEWLVQLAYATGDPRVHAVIPSCAVHASVDPSSVLDGVWASAVAHDPHTAAAIPDTERGQMERIVAMAGHERAYMRSVLRDPACGVSGLSVRHDPGNPAVMVHPDVRAAHILSQVLIRGDTSYTCTEGLEGMPDGQVLVQDSSRWTVGTIDGLWRALPTSMRQAYAATAMECVLNDDKNAIITTRLAAQRIISLAGSAS